MAAFQTSAPAIAGAKTRNVLPKKAFHIVISVRMTAKKDCLIKIKPYSFTLFVKRYGEEKLLDCLEENEKKGIVYHRDGINGDYDDFNDAEELINFILTGIR